VTFRLEVQSPKSGIVSQNLTVSLPVSGWKKKFWVVYACLGLPMLAGNASRSAKI